MQIYLYQNYHRHTCYTNPLITDSTATNEQYAARAAELGHKIISSCEHGYQGRYIECYELAKKYGLKFVFAAEAYWVRDRALADKTNCHIVLAARNEAGRKDINRILSEANISGFYVRPRLDMELILSLNPANVIVTTACIAFWKYDDIEEMMLKMAQHFGSNFFLEVQCHNTVSQQQLNQRILNLHYKYHIPLIFGCDSHYIESGSEQERQALLYAKGIEYPDEEGWYLDYPDGNEVYRRFAEQGVLSHKEILEALDNTNVFLQVEEYDSPIFNKEIKLPSLYPEWTQQQRDEEYTKIVWREWENYKKEIPTSQHELYQKEIQSEIDIVIESHMSDYFLLNYYIIKRGKELGGVITSTGRGSAVSFITNKLLGFTEVDRIAAQVQMYPERFMSATRILESGSMPDIDFNLGTIEPFAQAQKEILGETHAYPMIAYGTLKTSSAWKMYAKATNVPFIVSDAISKQIQKYEDAFKYADDDEKESIIIDDYIESKYLETYRYSEKYLNLISSWSPAPSAYLLYSGNIKEEIGLIKIKQKLCCLMDGHWAEDCKFLKNDLLKVVVVDVIDHTFKEIGIPRPTVKELLALCPPNDAAWEVYSRGCTIGVNQVEQIGTSARVAKYSPTNIAELCAFVAAIRPGFKSMYKKFESKQPFSYGIPSFDNLIQTPYMPNSFVLYQEQVMATLNYAGYPMADCYSAIKNIAKKRSEKVLALKEGFINGFSEKLRQSEHMSGQASQDTSEVVWQIVEDNSGYSFNASHAYCVALDSLYCAYLKSHYPMQFYGTYIRDMLEKGNKKKVNAAQAEAQSYFHIKFPPYRFGQDNSKVTIDMPNKSIYMMLKSIKGFNVAHGVVLSERGRQHYDYLSDLLCDIRPHGITENVTKKLAKIDYFEMFGNQREVNAIIDACEAFNYGERKTIRYDNFANNVLYKDAVLENSSNIGKNGNKLKTYTINSCRYVLHKIEETIKQNRFQELDLKVRIQNQIDTLGYISTVTNQESDRRLLVVLKLRKLVNSTSKQPWGYAIETQSLGSGKHGNMTIRAKDFDEVPVQVNSIIYANNVYQNNKGYWYLNNYELRG